MEQTIMMLPPEALLVGDNIRFSLKKYRIDSLAQSITDLGGVTTPLKVTKLTNGSTGPNGEQYMVREGNYRRAAVVKLNKDGAGVLLPCIVEEEGAASGVERLDRQLSENMDREDMSPMDMASTIQKYLALGVSRKDIRNRFQRPGGRKGLSMQPLSNSMLNIYVSFLQFPKAVQNKIHDGVLGVAAAYELSKSPRDKWEKILERAESNRQSTMDQEQKDEESYEADQAKTLEAEAKSKEQKAAIEEAEKTAAALQKESEAKVTAAAEAYATAKKIKDKEEKKAAEEAWKALEADSKEAERAALKAATEASKLREKADKSAAVARERAEKLAAARKAQATGPADIKAAVAQETNGLVKLNGSQMRKVIEDLNLPGSYPLVRLIGYSILRCFNSDITDAQLVSELGFITRERKEKPKTWKESTEK
jgi:hypothetical protein